MWNKLLECIEDIFGTSKYIKVIEANMKSKEKALSDLSSCVSEIKSHIDALHQDIKKPFDEVVREYKAEVEEARKEAEFFSMSLNELGDVIPDMLWMKYRNGEYAYTNRAIRENLLFDSEPLGKTDCTMGLNAQDKFGEDNHDFGKYCAGSDDMVIEHGHRKRFIEYGMSGGKPLVLEVFKNVVRDKHGSIIATVGCGRDITKMIFTMYEIVTTNEDKCGACSLFQSSLILDTFLGEYVYDNVESELTLEDFYFKHGRSYLDGR